VCLPQSPLPRPPTPLPLPNPKYLTLPTLRRRKIFCATALSTDLPRPRPPLQPCRKDGSTQASKQAAPRSSRRLYHAPYGVSWAGVLPGHLSILGYRSVYLAYTGQGVACCLLLAAYLPSYGSPAWPLWWIGRYLGREMEPSLNRCPDGTSVLNPPVPAAQQYGKVGMCNTNLPDRVCRKPTALPDCRCRPLFSVRPQATDGSCTSRYDKTHIPYRMSVGGRDIPHSLTHSPTYQSGPHPLHPPSPLPSLHVADWIWRLW